MPSTPFISRLTVEPGRDQRDGSERGDAQGGGGGRQGQGAQEAVGR